MLLIVATRLPGRVTIWSVQSVSKNCETDVMILSLDVFGRDLFRIRRRRSAPIADVDVVVDYTR